MSLFKNSYKSLVRQKSPSKAKGTPLKLSDDVASDTKTTGDKIGTNNSKESGIFDRSDSRKAKELSKDKAKRLLGYLKSHSLSDDADPTGIKKSTANFIPDLEEDDSDDSLIDLAVIGTSPVADSTGKKEFEQIDKILESKKRNVEDVDGEEGKLEFNTEETLHDSKRANIEGVHDPLLFQEVNHQLIEETKLKFSSLKVPSPIESRRQLLNRIERHLHIIPDQLTGEIPMSGFYKLAQLERNTSGQASLKLKDRFLINWDKFYAGYFGFIRQQFVASVILSKFNRKLLEAQKRNNTVAYWNVDNFSKYVLANEILLRLASEDFDCSLEEAEKIFGDTVEYGKVVADSVSLSNDLDIDELYRDERKHFMKGIDDNESKLENSTSSQAPPGVLDRMFNLDDSDEE